MPSVSPSGITYFADTTLNLKHIPPPCDSGSILLQDDYQRGLDADREEQGKLVRPALTVCLNSVLTLS